MAERLEPNIVYEVLHAEEPGTIQQLVDGIRKRISATQSEIVSLLRAMMRSGELKVKQEMSERRPPFYQQQPESTIGVDMQRNSSTRTAKDYYRHQNKPRSGLKAIFEDIRVLLFWLKPYKNESVVKALSFVLIFNVISWVIIIAFQTSVVLAPFRIVFHGVNLLFSPGFAMTILWYPFPSAQLDFTKLDRRSNVRDGRIVKEQSRARDLDPLTRAAYSICYSIGLVILAGFLIGLLGYGFNIQIMLSILSIIEIVIVVVVIFRIQRIRDPYLNI